MKYALLGNGFDLHHNLPTKYIDILRIFNFWTSHSDYSYGNIGELIDAYLRENLENQSDKNVIENLRCFYNAYRDKLYAETIDTTQTRDLLTKLKNSFWFSYFIQAKYEDIGWIDFEREIYSVLRIFKCIFKECPVDFKVIENNECPRFRVCSCETNLPHISIFENPSEENIVVFIDKTFKNRNLFKTHKPYNTEIIVEFLYKQLEIIQDAICFYLQHFVNSIIDVDMRSSSLQFLENTDVVITLNYTNTFEKIYKNISANATICHYHGTASDNNIVLGINSTSEDELKDESNPDTTFIVFKKYYQRILKNCDTEFLPLLEEEKNNLGIENYRKYKEYNPDELLIVGHSLDITDRDIIKELFSLCGNVYVYYHSLHEFGKYIKNLTQIFGKSSFEEMRKIGKLQFVELDKYQRTNDSSHD